DPPLTKIRSTRTPLEETRMSALTQPVVDVAADDHLARRNALVLAVTQALAGGNSTVLVATAGIVGTTLAPDKSLATLPISIYVLGMWMGTLPLGVLARRLGRRNALQIGTVCGVLTGLICCLAVLQGSFLLLNVGAVFSGFYASAHQSYRFAAADTASEAFRPKAISWVLFGGVVAAVVGPQLVIATQDLWPSYLFAATYIGQSALALISAGVLMFTNIPKPPPRAAAGGGRLRGCSLFDGESDLGAARHGHVQSLGPRRAARPAMARARHVCAELRHRRPYFPLRARTDLRSGPRPHHRRRRDRDRRNFALA